MTDDEALSAVAPGPGSHGGGLRGRYLRHEYLVVGVVSSIVYIAIAVNVKFLLNWIVGPAWPIVCMWVVPVLVRRVTGWDDPLPGEVAGTPIDASGEDPIP